jgi:hypothetical protein
MPFSTFLTALFQALDGEGVRCCILRNYEGFPTQNIGGDLDFLISPSELPRAMRALRTLQGIRIVGYAERTYVASVFLGGTSAILGCRSFQVDFFLSLSWKGLPYLPVDTVLNASVQRRVEGLDFFVPSPVHEAVTSLLTSLILSGWLKEKYLPKVQRTFAGGRPEVIAALRPQFGSNAATRLVDSVIDGDQRKIIECIRPIRISLVLRSLLLRPVRSIMAIARHYSREIMVRFSPKTTETVCFLGSNGGGKSMLIETLMPILQSSAKFVQRYPLEPRFPFVRKSSGMTLSPDVHAQIPSRHFESMTKIVLWLLEEWLYQFIGKENLTLRLSESCWYDLLAAPERYRYGGPMWFVRLVGKLFPSPELWILLDPATEGLQSSGEEVPPAEAQSLLEAYRAFVKTKRNYFILDASLPADQVTESAYAAIIDTLAQRADKTLKNRFQQRKDTN